MRDGPLPPLLILLLLALALTDCLPAGVCARARFFHVTHFYLQFNNIYTIHIMFWDRGKSLVPTDLLDDGSRRLAATARRVFISYCIYFLYCTYIRMLLMCVHAMRLECLSVSVIALVCYCCCFC